jgi:hypothetical protein
MGDVIVRASRKVIANEEENAHIEGISVTGYSLLLKLTIRNDKIDRWFLGETFFIR